MRTGKPLFEVRTIPGNLIGVGDTLDEAVESAIGLIRWTADEEPNWEAWYQEAWGFNSEDGDAEHFVASVFDPIKTIERTNLTYRVLEL